MIEPSSCGVLLRVYVKAPGEIEEVVARTVLSVKRATAAGFGQVVVVIPIDKDRGTPVGEMPEKMNGLGVALTMALVHNGCENVPVIVVHGNENSDALNAGVRFLKKFGTTHAFIVSNEASAMLVPENVWALCQAFDAGALVAGLAFGELYVGVLLGRISNTFAAWNIDCLREVGGFTSEQGVEEITPMLEMVRLYGKSIAPVLPIFEEEVEIREAAGARKRHKMGIDSKTSRQIDEAARIGGSLDDLAEGILPGYPK